MTKNENPNWLIRQLDISQEIVDAWSDAKRMAMGITRRNKMTKEILEELSKCKCEGVEFQLNHLEPNATVVRFTDNDGYWSVFLDDPRTIEKFTQELLKAGCMITRTRLSTSVACPTNTFIEKDHHLAIIKAFIKVFGEKE